MTAGGRPHRPPRAAERLLSYLLPSGLVEQSIRGDLREEHRSLSLRRGPLVAALWFWCATLGLAARYTVRAVRASRRGRSPHEGLADSKASDAMLGARQDIRYGYRSLIRRPFSSMAVILTLAIAIGASTAIFSVLHGVLLVPLGYLEPDRLVTLQVNTSLDSRWYGGSVPEYYDFKESLSSLERLAGYVPGVVTLDDPEEPRRVDVIFASYDLLPVLGTAPLLGRGFDREEDLAGAAPTVVLSHSLWSDRFDASPDALGQTLSIGGARRTVVGVMPAGFSFPDADTVAWMPLRYDPENLPNRSNHFLEMVGRLVPGVELTAAQAEAEGVASRLIEQYHANYSERGLRVRVESLRDRLLGDVRPPLLAIAGAVLFVLLVAAVSAANLMLSRGQERRRDFAVRAAMGASRGRMTWQFMAEVSMLSSVAALLGIALAVAGVRGLLALAPAGMPRLDSVQLSWPVLVFGVALALATGLVTGLAPALSISRVSLRESLHAGGRSQTLTARGRLVQTALVTVQITFAVVLAVGAVLMTRTMANLARVDSGLEARGALTVRLDPDFNVYQTAEDRIGYYEQLLPRLDALPDVVRAAAVVWLPLLDTASQWSFEIEGQRVDNIGAAPDAFVQQVTPGYFEALGVSILRGRGFTSGDRPDSLPVAIVNESMARTFWPKEEVLGRRFRVYGEGRPWLEIVGVAWDVKHDQLKLQAPPQFYIPHAQGSSSTYFTGLGMTLVLRGSEGRGPAVEPVRREIRRHDATAALSRIQTMDAVLAESVDRERFTLLLLGAFSVIAVLLAAIGVYGVASYAVSRRTREIGLRLALGASARSIIREVLSQALVVVVLGSLLGVGGGVATAVGLRSLLYQVAPADPMTLALVAVLMALAALLASVFPARRAVAIDPTLTLRSE